MIRFEAIHESTVVERDEHRKSMEYKKLSPKMKNAVDAIFNKLDSKPSDFLNSFEKTMNSQNRFLSDFISLVKQHNFRWLPEPSISALQPTNKRSILRRLESTIEEIEKTTEIGKLNYNDRLGLEFYRNWAKEILFSINDKGNLGVSIYPGNTKSQGYSLFKKNIIPQNKI